MYTDLSSTRLDEYWTVALVEEGRDEVHFGVFADVGQAMEAKSTKLVVCREGQRLSLRRIRKFPTGD